MGQFGGYTLHFGKHVRVERKLQHVLGRHTPLQLCVGDLIAEIAEFRGNRHPLEKIRPTTPLSGPKRALKYHAWAAGHCRTSGVGILRKVATARNFHDTQPGVSQRVEMRSLVRIPQLLEKFGVFVVFLRFGSHTAHVLQIECGGMVTPHEAHQIRCG